MAGPVDARAVSSAWPEPGPRQPLGRPQGFAGLAGRDDGAVIHDMDTSP